ncbi:MAG: glycosyltransferase family 4 protein [Planctomycetes bacterium]|nr:glycosyltransferase family 4 protein [Planctomycetota bacterium]
MRTKHKVCILTSLHSPLDGRIFHRQAKTLAQEGYDVTLIAQYDKEDIVGGVRIIPLPKTKNRFKRMTKTSWLLFRLALKQKADVYHFHDVELIFVGIFLKLMNKKVIYDVHEDYPKALMSKFWIPTVLRKFMAVGIDCIQKVCMNFFDLIIVAGDDIAESFSKCRLCKKMIVLRNVPLKGFAAACSTDGQKPNNIIYVGALLRIRGIMEITEAMKYVRNVARLYLVGTFVRTEFEREVRQLATENVEIIGQVNYAEIPNFLRTAKIGLICFYPEPNHIGALSGRNNKLYEYMAGGLAIIGSDLPSWKEIIESGPVGVTVNPKNPKAIASAIDYLLDNPEVLKQMGRNARKAIFEKYNWESESEKLLEVYGKLLNHEK